MTRVAKNFENIAVIKTLYCSLVVPKLEYAALVWSPSYLNQIKRIEQLQRKFLKFMCWKSDGIYPERGCDHFELCARFNLFTLEERRIVVAIMFIVKLVRGNIDCPQFLEQLPFRLPSVNSRYHVPFYLPLASSSLLLASPLYRACNYFNRLFTFSEGGIDLVASSMSDIVTMINKFIIARRP